MKLTVSQIFSDTFAAMKEHFWGLIGLWLTFFAITAVAMIVFFMVMGGGVMAMAGAIEGADGAGFGAGVILFMFVFYVVYLLLACAQTAALNAMASPLRRVDFGEAFGLGWRSSPTLLLVMVLLVIAYFVGALVAGMIFAALASLGSAVAVVAAILLFLGVMYLACRLSIVFPIVPVDGVRNPITAISRSWGLTRGNALSIFLSFLLLFVIFGVLVGVLILPFMGTIMSMDNPNAAPALGGLAFFFIGAIVLSVVFAVTYAAFLSAIHGRLAGSTGEQLSETFE